jgi:hypothetical protein
MPGRKIRPVNWYSIFLPHIFLLLSVGVELPNQYRLIFADELIVSLASRNCCLATVAQTVSLRGFRQGAIDRDLRPIKAHCSRQASPDQAAQTDSLRYPFGGANR